MGLQGGIWFERKAKTVLDAVSGNFSAERLHLWRRFCDNNADAQEIRGASGLDRGAGDARSGGDSAVLSGGHRGQRGNTGRLSRLRGAGRGRDGFRHGAAAARHNLGHLVFLRRLPQQRAGQSRNAGHAGRGRGGHMRRGGHDVRQPCPGAERPARADIARRLRTREVFRRERDLRHTRRCRYWGLFEGLVRTRIERRRA